MKSLEEKIKNLGKKIISLGLISALIAAISCSKKEEVFGYIGEGPPTTEKHENPALPYYENALKFKEQGQLDSSLFYSQKAIDNRRILESEQMGDIYLCRAQIFQDLNQNKEAIEAYKRTIYYYCSKEKFDEASQTASELANLHEKLGNKEKAELYKRKVVEFKEYKKRFKRN